MVWTNGIEGWGSMGQPQYAVMLLY